MKSLILFLGILFSFSGIAQNLSNELSKIGGDIIINNGNVEILEVKVSTDENYVVFCTSNRLVKVYNLKQNSILSLELKDIAQDISISPDSKFFVAACKNNIAYAYTLEGKYLFSFNKHGAPIKEYWDVIYSEFGICQVNFLPNGNVMTCGQDQVCYEWKFDSTQTIVNSLKTTSSATSLINFDVSSISNATKIWGSRKGGAYLFQGNSPISLGGQNIAAVAISESGKSYSFASQYDIRIAPYNTTEIVSVYNSNGNYTKFGMDGVSTLAFINDDQLLVGSKFGNINLYSTNGALIKSFQKLDNPINSIALLKKTNRFLTAQADGSIRIWDKSEGLQYTILSSFENNSELLIYENRTGYFSSNCKETNLVKFKINNLTYSLSQFDIIFNRPDLILPTFMNLGLSEASHWKELVEKRKEITGFNEKFVFSDKELPKIKVKIIGENITANNSAKISIESAGNTIPLTKMDILINGVPYFGKNGLDLKNTINFTDTIELKLVYGKNKVAVSITNNKGLESYREEKLLVCTEKSNNPTLFFIGIGSGKFSRDTIYNLRAKDDLKGLVDTIKKNTNKYYKEIKPLFLTDENVSEKNILSIKKELLNSKPNDVVLLYFIGHGVKDPADNSYYLSSYSIDFENPKDGGLTTNLLDNLLDSIPCINKIIFLNACHAGEYNREQALFDEMKNSFLDLRRHSGAFMITSSTSELSSYFPEVGYSLFTKALFNVFNSKEPIFVNTILPQIPSSGRFLQPTLRQYNSMNNFRIW